MVFSDVAKAGREHIFHAETRISGQDDALVAIAQLLIAQPAVVTRDAALTTRDVDAFVLCNRTGGVECDRVPDALGAALTVYFLSRGI